jgi:hypothetical protein
MGGSLAQHRDRDATKIAMVCSSLNLLRFTGRLNVRPVIDGSTSALADIAAIPITSRLV